MRLLVCRRSTPAATRRGCRLPCWPRARWPPACPAAAGRATKPTPLPPVQPHRDGPVSMFTVGAELYTNSAANMNLLQSLGVGCRPPGHELDRRSRRTPPRRTSRRSMPRDPNAYPAASWARYDALIRGLTARHIGIDLALIGAAAPVGRGSGCSVAGHPARVEARRRRLCGLGACGRDPLQRAFHSPGRVTSAAADRLLVGLE